MLFPKAIFLTLVSRNFLIASIVSMPLVVELDSLLSLCIEIIHNINHITTCRLAESVLVSLLHCPEAW